MDGSRDDELELDTLVGALDTLRTLVECVEDSHLGLSTPCDEFDVRGLLEHVIGWQRVFAACASSIVPPFADGSPTYRLGSRPTDDLHEASSALVVALERAPESLELPYRGLTDRRTVVDELVAETVIHAWDVARALGSKVTFDERTVAVAHEGLTKLLGASFAPFGFRAPDAEPGPATDLDALIDRSGRQR